MKVFMSFVFFVGLLSSSTISAGENDAVAFSKYESFRKLRVFESFVPARLEAHDHIEVSNADNFAPGVPITFGGSNFTSTVPFVGEEEIAICSVAEQGGTSNCSAVVAYRWRCSSIQGPTTCSIGEDNTGYTCTVHSGGQMTEACSTANTSNGAELKSCSVVNIYSGGGNGDGAIKCSTASTDGQNGFCSVAAAENGICSTAQIGGTCSVQHNSNHDPNTVVCSVINTGACSTNQTIIRPNTCSVSSFEHPASCSVSGNSGNADPGFCSTNSNGSGAICSISGSGGNGDFAFCSVAAPNDSSRCSVNFNNISDPGKCSVFDSNGGGRACSVMHFPNSPASCTVINASIGDPTNRCSAHGNGSQGGETACSVLNPESGVWNGPDSNGICSASTVPIVPTNFSTETLASDLRLPVLALNPNVRNRDKRFVPLFACLSFAFLTSAVASFVPKPKN